MEMPKKKKEYKNVKLQHSSGRFYLTIPEWMVRKVLDAKKGDLINVDFKGNELILKKQTIEEK